MNLQDIQTNDFPAIGSKVIHVSTLEVGTVNGYSLSPTKLRINFPGCPANYPAPKRNLKLIVQ